jgi:hypothetical protein
MMYIGSFVKGLLRYFVCGLRVSLGKYYTLQQLW